MWCMSEVRFCFFVLLRGHVCGCVCVWLIVDLYVCLFVCVFVCSIVWVLCFISDLFVCVL